MVGKNLFYFFENAGVLHFHFGMSGRFSVWDEADAEPPKPTTRLELRGHGMVGHLSAMTVQHGGHELWESKKSALGEVCLNADLKTWFAHWFTRSFVRPLARIRCAMTPSRLARGKSSSRLGNLWARW